MAEICIQIAEKNQVHTTLIRPESRVDITIQGDYDLTLDILEYLEEYVIEKDSNLEIK